MRRLKAMKRIDKYLRGTPIPGMIDLEERPTSVRMPFDLQPRRVLEREGAAKSKGSPGYDPSLELLKSMADSLGILSSAQVLEQGFSSRQVSITTTPTRIIQAQFLRGYIISNPSPTAGLTTTGTILASAQRAALASGNTQAAADRLGVANYRQLKMFLNISATGGGVVTVNAQSLDPASSNWATTQQAFLESAVGTYYANLGEHGVDDEFAVAWDVSAAGTSTFSIGYVLKDGLIGNPSGLNNTIYIGGAGVTSVSGYSLSEGKELKFWLRPNTEVWAVSPISTGVTVNIFELQ